MQAADFVAFLVILNKFYGEGQKLAVHLNGRELTNDELYEKAKLVQLRILKNKEDDLEDKTD